MLKIIEKLVYLYTVLYNPNIQNIGNAKSIAIIAGKILKSLNKTSSSNLKQNASQVQRIHKAISVIKAIVVLEYRCRDKIALEKSFK